MENYRLNHKQCTFLRNKHLHSPIMLVSYKFDIPNISFSRPIFTESNAYNIQKLPQGVTKLFHVLCGSSLDLILSFGHGLQCQNTPHCSSIMNYQAMRKIYRWQTCCRIYLCKGKLDYITMFWFHPHQLVWSTVCLFMNVVQIAYVSQKCNYYNWTFIHYRDKINWSILHGLQKVYLVWSIFHKLQTKI